MATFRIELDDGRALRVNANSEDEARSLAEQHISRPAVAKATDTVKDYLWGAADAAMEGVSSARQSAIDAAKRLASPEALRKRVTEGPNYWQDAKDITNVATAPIVAPMTGVVKGATELVGRPMAAASVPVERAMGGDRTADQLFQEMAPGVETALGASGARAGFPAMAGPATLARAEAKALKKAEEAAAKAAAKEAAAANPSLMRRIGSAAVEGVKNYGVTGLALDLLLPVPGAGIGKAALKSGAKQVGRAIGEHIAAAKRNPADEAAVTGLASVRDTLRAELEARASGAGPSLPSVPTTRGATAAEVAEAARIADRESRGLVGPGPGYTTHPWGAPPSTPTSALHVPNAVSTEYAPAFSKPPKGFANRLNTAVKQTNREEAARPSEPVRDLLGTLNTTDASVATRDARALARAAARTMLEAKTAAQRQLAEQAPYTPAPYPVEARAQQALNAFRRMNAEMDAARNQMNAPFSPNPAAMQQPQMPPQAPAAPAAPPAMPPATPAPSPAPAVPAAPVEAAAGDIPQFLIDAARARSKLPPVQAPPMPQPIAPAPMPQPAAAMAVPDDLSIPDFLRRGPTKVTKKDGGGVKVEAPPMQQAAAKADADATDVALTRMQENKDKRFPVEFEGGTAEWRFHTAADAPTPKLAVQHMRANMERQGKVPQVSWDHWERQATPIVSNKYQMARELSRELGIDAHQLRQELLNIGDFREAKQFRQDLMETYAPTAASRIEKAMPDDLMVETWPKKNRKFKSASTPEKKSTPTSASSPRSRQSKKPKS